MGGAGACGIGQGWEGMHRSFHPSTNAFVPCVFIGMGHSGSTPWPRLPFNCDANEICGRRRSALQIRQHSKPNHADGRGHSYSFWSLLPATGRLGACEPCAAAMPPSCWLRAALLAVTATASVAARASCEVALNWVERFGD